MDLKNYASFTVDKLLRLVEGDALSINTENKDFDIARTIANYAVEKTKVCVKIVVTENGRPQDVIDFDPSSMQVESKSAAMLRLLHIDSDKIEDKATLDIIPDKDNLLSIQKIGHLAEPVLLNRRITLPWCVLPVYNSEDPRWLEVEKTIDNFDTNINNTDFSIKFLQHADVKKIYITGDRTNLELSIPEDWEFLGGTQSLPSSRKFVNSLDFENICVSVDKFSTNGRVKAQAVILGKQQELELEFENGKLANYTQSKELDRLLSLDDNLKYVGFISMENKSFALNLGGALIDSVYPVPDSEESIPKEFNNCLFTLKLNLEEKLNFTIENCEKKQTEIIRKGFFIQ